MTLAHSSLIYTITGISVFMFGMTSISDHLQKLTANRVRDIIQKLTEKPFFGVFIGILMTIFIQSSGAVTTLLVGLGSAKVLTLKQIMSLILGVTIGSTLTVQLISLNVSQFGMAIFAFSFLTSFLAKRRGVKDVMSIFMGFGLIFWGMELIGQGTAELRQVQSIADGLAALKESPLIAVLLSALFTAIVHSSAVTIGFAMTLVNSDLLTLTDSVYWVFGANIGTTATALVASLGSNTLGKRVAWAHCFYKVSSVALFFPLVGWLVEYISTGETQRDIANIHTAYNVLAALLFYPGLQLGARLIEKFIPDGLEEDQFSLAFINQKNWQSLPVAMAHAEREILRMGDIVKSMLNDSLRLFKNYEEELFLSIKKRDDQVDLLYREIKFYLIYLMDKQVSGQSREYESLLRLLNFCADLEKVADVIDNNMIDLAKKKHDLKLEFSPDGWRDLAEMHQLVIRLADLSLASLQKPEPKMLSEVLHYKREARKLEATLQERHVQRLIKSQPETMKTSSIHIDLLGEYRRSSGLLANHVYTLMKETDAYNQLPTR